jgi:hypothetical protein
MPMRQYIVVHAEQGIYLGNCIGLGFWSNLDPAGQTAAPTFLTESQAKDHVATWDAPHGDPEDYTYVELSIEKDGTATMEECMDAWQKPWPKTLEENCKCGKPKPEWRRMCCQYNQEHRNWMWSCEDCYEDNNDHYQLLMEEARPQL